MRTLPLIVAGCLVATAPTSAQVVSRTGEFLAPWGAVGLDPADMTDDGVAPELASGQAWIVFVESNGTGCDGPTEQRISLMRADGTGYRVAVDEVALAAIEPNGETLIDRIVMTADATQAVFSWPDSVSACAKFAPIHSYLVDLVSGDVNEILFNNQVVVDVSLTDDGRTMAFQGYDPQTDSWTYYRSGLGFDPAGLGAEPIPVAPGLNIALGTISGNGSAFLFIDDVCCPADLLVHQFASGMTTTLTPAPVPTGIGWFGISDDATRAAYGAESVLWGVATDGTQHHVMIDPPPVKGASMTGSGSHVLYTTGFGSEDTRRVPWMGGSEEIIPLIGGSAPADVACDSNGKVVMGWDFQAGGVLGPVPLAVWFESPPILTTYGFGVPGTTITWDIGGSPGDPFLLGYAWQPAAVRFQQFGTLGLDPATLQILALGTVSAPQNIGQVSVIIPPSVVVPSDIDVYFQSLVFGSTGALTNTTAFTITAGAAMGDVSTIGASRQPAERAHSGRPAPAAGQASGAGTFTSMMDEARWRDPARWMAEMRVGRAVGRPLER